MMEMATAAAVPSSVGGRSIAKDFPYERLSRRAHQQRFFKERKFMEVSQYLKVVLKCLAEPDSGSTMIISSLTPESMASLMLALR